MKSHPNSLIPVFLASAFLLLATGACAAASTPPTPAQPPEPNTVPTPTQPTSLAPAGRLRQLTESWLSEAIRSVPPDYGQTYLRFANYEAARSIAGADDFEGMSAVFTEGSDTIPWTYTLLFSDSSVSSYRGEIYEESGLDFYVADTYIWTEPQAFSSPTLRIVTGVVDDSSSLGDRLMEFDYQSANHGGTDYYYSWTDKFPSADIFRQNPFRSSVRQWNALAVIGDTLLARKRIQEMPQLIDVHKGNLPSLYDDQGHRELAQAVGEELLTGAFLKPGYVVDGWNESGLKKNLTKNEQTPPGKLASYSDTWGTMEPYTVAVLGYGVVDGVGRNVIGMHYANREAAGRNADELMLRWNSSHLYISSIYLRRAGAVEPGLYRMSISSIPTSAIPSRPGRLSMRSLRC